MPSLRIQSAMEYLTTYSWAILIIAIVFAALFALGVFSPLNFISTQCVLPAGFSCTSIFLSGNGLMSINLLQATPQTINVTALSCNANNTFTHMQVPVNPPTNQIRMQIGANYTFNFFCYAGSSIYTANPGYFFNGYLIINYTETASGFPHTASGRVIAKVT